MVLEWLLMQIFVYKYWRIVGWNQWCWFQMLSRQCRNWIVICGLCLIEYWRSRCLNIVSIHLTEDWSAGPDQSWRSLSLNHFFYSSFYNYWRRHKRSYLSLVRFKMGWRWLKWRVVIWWWIFLCKHCQWLFSLILQMIVNGWRYSIIMVR